MKDNKNIEDVKSYWNNRPCNIRHSFKQIGTKEYFDEVEKKKFFVEPHIITFSEFQNWNNKNVLEIGCGIGTAAINFARNGANYTGIELSEKSLNLTKKRFEVYFQKGQFYCGNAESLSSFLPQSKYDLIYSFGVIHHSPNPEKIIKEIKNYMHKDSILKIMLYSKNSWKNIMINGGFDQPEAQSGCPIAITYTKQEVKELLNGFDILEIKKDHIFSYDLESYKNNLYKKLPWFESMSKQQFEHLEKNLGWHLLITAKLGVD